MNAQLTLIVFSILFYGLPNYLGHFDYLLGKDPPNSLWNYGIICWWEGDPVEILGAC